AGVIAGVALGWLLLGILVVWPSAGLSFGAEFNPNRILPWVHKHEAMFWAVNILGGLLAAVMSVVLYLAAGDRFTNNAPASARIGALFGVFGSFGFGAAALLRQYGMGPLSMLYSSNSVGSGVHQVGSRPARGQPLAAPRRLNVLDVPPLHEKQPGDTSPGCFIGGRCSSASFFGV